MRPRLRPGVACVPSDEGVHLTAPFGVVDVNGRSAAVLMDALLPHLDGTAAIDDLLEQFDTPARPAVRSLLETLASHRLVRDASQDPPHALADEDIAHFGPVHRLIESRADAPATRLERVLSTTILLRADDRTVAHQIRALLHVGFRRFEVNGPSPEGPGARRARQLVEAETTVEPTPRARLRWHAELPLHLAAEAATAAISNRLDDDPDETATLEARAVAEGAAFGTVLWQDGAAWVAPPTSGPPAAGWGSMCWRLREAGRLSWPGGATTSHGAASDPYLTDPVIAVAANRLAMSLLELVAGLVEAPQGWELRTDTLEAKSLRVAPHQRAPLTARRAPSATGPEALEDGRRREGPPPEEFSRAAMRLFDEVAGPLLSLGEADLPQVPLAASAADVANVGGYRPDGSSLRVVAYGVDLSEARHQVTQRALQVAALEAAGPRARDEERWAHDLENDRTVRVPHPLTWLLDGVAPDQRSVPGLSSGRRYEDALAAGLLSLVADAASAGRLPGAVPPAPANLDAASERTRLLTRMLNTVRPRARLVSLGSPQGISLVAVHDGTWLSLAARPDPEEAVAAAIAEAVAADQGVADSTRPAARLRSAPPADDAPGVELAPAPSPPPASEVVSRATQLLVDAGQPPLALSLDADPAIAALAPHVVAVLPRDP